MNSQVINGFMVVTGTYEGLGPLRNGVIYRGYDRDLPKGFFDDYFGKTMSDDILPIYKLIDENSMNEIGCDYTTSHRDALALYHYCSDKWSDDTLTIITIYSEAWRETEPLPVGQLALEFMGYDICFTGYHYSLLAMGLFMWSEHFDAFIDKVNSHGLLPDKATCEAYVKYYRKMAEKGICETWGMEAEPLVIEVGKVLL